jgi:hypothetical protein
MIKVAYSFYPLRIYEYPRNNFPLFSLETQHESTLLFHHVEEFSVKVNHPPLPVLRRARIEANFSCVQVNLSPLEIKHFSYAPAGVVAKGCHWSKKWRQSATKGKKFLILEKSGGVPITGENCTERLPQ